METTRAEAFSDGVFAIAITLLVLGLRPEGSGALGQQLLHAWPRYFAYIVSFLTIGIMWMNHHTIMGHVTRVDRPLLVINLLLLMGVVAIPFPTALVAENLHGSGGPVAAETYGLVMIVISAGFAGLWIYIVTHASRVGAALPPQTLRRSIPRFTLGGAVYAAGTVVAALGFPLAALITFGMLAVYYLFEHLPSPEPGTDPAS